MAVMQVQTVSGSSRHRPHGVCPGEVYIHKATKADGLERNRLLDT